MILQMLIRQITLKIMLLSNPEGQNSSKLNISGENSLEGIKIPNSHYVTTFTKLQQCLIMRRYFYNDIGIISKWLERNVMAKSFQDSVYRSAFLSAFRHNPTQTFENIKESILNMTIAQQQKYANNHHIQGLFNHFTHLHRYSRGRAMIVDALKNQGSTALVDPDKFPIWDLKKYSSVYQSLWGMHLAQLRHDLGFQAIIRESQVQHIAGGRGVYLILPENKKSVPPGEFLGLVPGKVFASFNDFKSVSINQRKQYHRDPQHIHFPTGKILELGDLPIRCSNSNFGLSTQQTNERVDATFHNPYAFGHMINHPPPNCEANVIFSEMNIRTDYFPRYLMRYLPYEDYIADKKTITLFGVFSIKQIEHKQELFVNYNQSHIYPIDAVPQWLIEPPKFSPIFNFLKKGQYEIPQSGFWKVVQQRALKRNKQLLEKYQKQVHYRPGDIEFEDKSHRFRKMKIRLQDQNEFQHL